MRTLMGRLVVWCVISILLPAALAHAEDAPKKPMSLTATLGYVSTGGNSEVQTLAAGDKLDYISGAWLWTQDGEALWGTDHGVENAGRYFVGLRADRSFNPRLSGYGLTGWRRNVFGGVSRQFEEGAGVVLHALIPEPQLLDFEAGASLIQRLDTFDQNQDFTAGRVATSYRYNFSEKRYLDAQGYYLHNFKDSEDYEWDAKASVVAPLSNILALKFGYTYHFRNAPPAGIKQWDSTFAASIQATW